MNRNLIFNFTLTETLNAYNVHLLFMTVYQ